ncbi:MAG: dockerin type I repeat-containing protein [Ruminococcus sp.]|nr:dockerin type I repeat-containing protein [Ruminococcus sp.]
MNKKKIVSTLIAMAMCVSALPMSVCAETTTNAEYPEFTRKFREECLLNPEESEENRLIHNLYGSFYDGGKEFLGLYSKYTSTPYYLKYSNNMATVPGHDDIKCVQYICKDNYTWIADYIDNPYITEKEFNALSYDKKLITAGKIFDETGEYIASMMSTCLAIFPYYYIGEDGKGYDFEGEEMVVLNGEVMSAYCNPEELNIYDGKSVYQYSDVYDGDPATALITDFYKYLEDNNVQQVFNFWGEFDNQRAYYGIDDYHEYSDVEDLSAETFITDLDGNIIPNDPDFLRIIDTYGNNIMICVYKIDGKYIFEDKLGNRIVFSSFDDSENNNTDDSYVLMDFFNDHSIDERFNTDNVIETYLADENDLKFYNTDVLATEKLTGDANLDGNVNMSDAVLIMQSLSNPDEYKLSEHGKINADYNGDGSVTALDALEIQMLMIS